MRVGEFRQVCRERYGADVVGITVSAEQEKYAKEKFHDMSIEIRLQDYRDLHETFDRIVSIGMIEHVGYRNYRTFMEVVHRCLAPDGKFLLKTIGGNMSTTSNDLWLEKYFPQFDAALGGPDHESGGGPVRSP